MGGSPFPDPPMLARTSLSLLASAGLAATGFAQNQVSPSAVVDATGGSASAFVTDVDWAGEQASVGVLSRGFYQWFWSGSSHASLFDLASNGSPTPVASLDGHYIGTLDDGISEYQWLGDHWFDASDDRAVGSAHLEVRDLVSIGGWGPLSDLSYVRVYERDASNAWSVGASFSATQLTLDGIPTCGAEIDGDTFVVATVPLVPGSWNGLGYDVDHGAVRIVEVYERDQSGTWTMVRQLPHSSLFQHDDVAELALDGEAFACGLPDSSVAGKVVLAKRSGWPQWSWGQSLTGSLSVAGDRYGSQVEFEGGTLLVGDGSRIYCYTSSTPQLGGGFVETDVIDATGSISLSGDRFVVHDADAAEAKVFARTESGAWILEAALEGLIADVTFFGGSGDQLDTVDILGSRVLVADGASSSAFGFSNARVYHLPTLSAVVDTVSLTNGPDAEFLLQPGPEHAGSFYAMVGSMTGTAPALPIAGTALELPLVPDLYFDFTLLTLTNGGFLSNSFGVIDEHGRARATFGLPPGLDPQLVGTPFHHAFALIDPTEPIQPISHISNAATITIAP